MLTESDLKLKKAEYGDVLNVAQLYEEAKKGKYCPWNEKYPTKKEAENDYLNGCLYVLKNGDKLLGACSVEPVAEDDDLEFWRVIGNHCEIARVVVSPLYQGCGYGCIMIKKLCELLKREGVRSVHLLVQVDNVPAISVYNSLDFEILGKCERYGSTYFASEKIM